MPWCPNCRAEYRQGYTNCSDCEVELVEELEPEENKDGEYENDKEAYLTTITSDMEAETIESLLKSMDIPVLKKYRGTGGYLKVYLGDTIFGIDIYVPSKQLDQANAILQLGIPETEKEIVESEQESVTGKESVTDEIQPELYGNESSEWERKRNINRRFLKWYAILMISALIWSVLSMLYQVFDSLFK